MLLWINVIAHAPVVRVLWLPISVRVAGLMNSFGNSEYRWQKVPLDCITQIFMTKNGRGAIVAILDYASKLFISLLVVYK